MNLSSRLVKGGSSTRWSKPYKKGASSSKNGKNQGDGSPLLPCVDSSSHGSLRTLSTEDTTDISSRDIRPGGARDLSHLKRKLKSVADNSTTKAIGHARLSAIKNVTDSYVGAINEDIFNSKKALDYKDRNVLAFRPSFRKRQLQTEDLTSNRLLWNWIPRTFLIALV